MGFNRVLLKLSGEALMGSRDYGLDATTVDHRPQQRVDLRGHGRERALVIGGGNSNPRKSAAAPGIDTATR
ncbi:MAG: UMP kinase, partial [Gaiellaceae bacterium]